MKNFLLLGMIFLCLYLYKRPKVEQPAEAQEPAQAEEVSLATPTPPSRLYYHSPLDAPAAPTYVNSTAGYYSAEAGARFNPATSNVPGHTPSTLERHATTRSGATGSVVNPVPYSGVGTTSSSLNQPASRGR